MGELGVAIIAIVLILIAAPFIFAKLGIEAVVLWVTNHSIMAVIIFYLIIIALKLLTALLLADRHEKINRICLICIPSRCIADTGLLVFAMCYVIPTFVRANYKIGFGLFFNLLIYGILLFITYAIYWSRSADVLSDNKIRNDYIRSILF